MRASSGVSGYGSQSAQPGRGAPLLCLLCVGVYSQLSLEDHNQGGEGDAHGHTVGQAQEERGEEADHPDTL